MTMRAETALRVLKGCEWLRGEPPALAQALVSCGRLLHLNAGEWAQTEGDEHRGLVIVVEGATGEDWAELIRIFVKSVS